MTSPHPNTNHPNNPTLDSEPTTTPPHPIFSKYRDANTRQSTYLYDVTVYILSYTLRFLFQSLINLTLLIGLLLRDLWRATRYLYINLTTSPTAHSLRIYVFQQITTASQVSYKIATRICNAVLLGALNAIWSIWEIEDRIMARIIPAPNQTNRTNLIQCAGYTDKGRCERAQKVASGGIWYCFQHKRQGIRQAVSMCGISLDSIAIANMCSLLDVVQDLWFRICSIGIDCIRRDLGAKGRSDEMLQVD